MAWAITLLIKLTPKIHLRPHLDVMGALDFRPILPQADLPRSPSLLFQNPRSPRTILIANGIPDGFALDSLAIRVCDCG